MNAHYLLSRKGPLWVIQCLNQKHYFKSATEARAFCKQRKLELIRYTKDDTK